MIKRKKLLKTVLLVCGVLICGSPAFVKAQDFEVRIPIKASGAPRSKPAQPRPQRETVQRVINTVRTVETVRMQKTSNLSVSTEAGATVLLESLDARTKKVDKKTASEKGVVVFEDLPPTNYKIRVEKNGFKTQVQDLVKIQPQRTLALDMELLPITRDLSINTNINEGEVRYAPADLIETRADGSLVLKENAGYCIEPIKNGKAVIRRQKIGYYSIDIRPSANDIQFEQVKTAVKVEAIDKGDEPDDSLSFEIALQKKISEGIFTSAWTSDDWEKPDGWKFVKKLKTDGLPGVALPSNEQYRYYANFEMTSDVRLLHADSVGFVARAQDNKNYYLFQISGAKAETPLVIKGYVVKNDKADPPFFTQTIAPFAKTLAAGNFRVIIKGNNNTFSFFIEDTANGGEPRPVGDFSDLNNNFRKGAVGIAARQNWDFEVALFTVCARNCN